MPICLRNGYWELLLADDQALVTSLRFDATGGSNWCANLLKTGAPRASHLRLTGPTGGQTGYVDAAGAWHLSGTAVAAKTERVGEAEAVIEGGRYGSVTERWRLRLDGPRLEWEVTQTWRETVDLTDAFSPGLFFSAQAAWGEATFFVLWELGMAKDLFYGTGSILGPESTTASTRQTRREAGGWAIAKLLSHAGPNGDLRVATSHHLKKGEIENFSSVLAQSPWCDATAGRIMRSGETLTTKLTLEPVAAPTGLALELALPGPWQADARVNRRFFEGYANCGIMADTHDWRLGNGPSGYVALLCRYFHSEMLRFGVLRGTLGPDSTDVRRVLEAEVVRMADHLVADGTVGPGYQSSTSLDLYPSFLLCMRDVLLVTGDRILGERLWRGAQRALEALFRQLGEGDGMIRTTREDGNDYWDWISRSGHIGYVNILAWTALQAAAETAVWLGRAGEVPRIAAHAERVREKYEREFWSEERGYYADWIDLDGVPRFYLYAPPQCQAIVAGMVTGARATRVVDAVQARRRELGPEWEHCFSIQTNFHDAEEYSFMHRRFGVDVTRFGQTMNGGCLASWNYHWIGALVKVGRVEEALAAWRTFMARVGETLLVEGSNYWDFSGRPSRTVVPVMIPRAFPAYEPIAAEPFLSDQGLVACALPRWLLGIELTLAGESVRPVLPATAYPATLTLCHLGRERVLEISGPGTHCWR